MALTVAEIAVHYTARMDDLSRTTAKVRAEVSQTARISGAQAERIGASFEGAARRSAKAADDMIAKGEQLRREGKKGAEAYEGWARRAGDAAQDLATKAVAAYASMDTAVTAIQISGDYEATMIRIRDALSASAAEMQTLNIAARELGRSPLGVTAREAAEGFEILARNGLSARQILDGAAMGALVMSRAMGVDLSDAADLATDVMGQFKIQASALPGIADQLAGAANASKFSFEDLRQAIANAGGVAATAGMSFEELNAGIAAISSQFASGADAGTSFKTLLTSLSGSSTEARREMDRLGLSFYDAQGNIKTLAEIAEQLKRAMSGLSEQARITSLKTIFGEDAIRAAAALADQGAAGIDRLTAAIGRVSATEHATNRMQGLQGALMALNAAWEDLLMTVADEGGLTTATAAIERLTGALTHLQENFAEILPWVERVATVLAAGLIAQGLAPLVAKAAAAGAGLIALASSAGGASAVVAALGTSAVGLGRQFADLAGGVEKARDAKGRFVKSGFLATGMLRTLGVAAAALTGPMGILLTIAGITFLEMRRGAQSAADRLDAIQRAAMDVHSAYGRILEIDRDLASDKEMLSRLSKEYADLLRTEGSEAKTAAAMELQAIRDRIAGRESLRRAIAAETAVKMIDARDNLSAIEAEAHGLGAVQVMGGRQPWLGGNDPIAKANREALAKRPGVAEYAGSAWRGMAEGALEATLDGPVSQADRDIIALNARLEEARAKFENLRDLQKVIAEAGDKPLPQLPSESPTTSPISDSLNKPGSGISAEIDNIIRGSGAASLKIRELEGHVTALRAALETAPEGKKGDILAAITAYEDQIKRLREGPKSSGSSASDPLASLRRDAALATEEIERLTAIYDRFGATPKKLTALEEAQRAAEEAQRIEAAKARAPEGGEALAEKLERDRIEADRLKEALRALGKTEESAAEDAKKLTEATESLRLAREEVVQAMTDQMRLQSILSTQGQAAYEGELRAIKARDEAQRMAREAEKAGVKVSVEDLREEILAREDAMVATEKLRQQLDLFDGADERAQGLRDELDLIGKRGEEYERVRTSLEMLRALEKEDIEITATLRGDVLEKAAEIARLLTQIERRRLLVDLGVSAEDAEADARMEVEALGLKGAALDALKLKAQTLRALEKAGHEATADELAVVSDHVRRYEAAKTHANVAMLRFGIGDDLSQTIRQIEQAVEAVGKTEAEVAALSFAAAQMEKHRNLGIAADPDALAKIAQGAQLVREATEAQMRATALEAAGETRRDEYAKIAEAREQIGRTEAQIAGLAYRASEMARWRNLGISAPPEELQRIEEGVARITAETEALQRAQTAEAGRVSGREALAGLGDALAQVGQTEAAVARLSYVASEMAKHRNLGIEADPAELALIAERASEIGAKTQELVDARARERIDTSGQEAWIALQYELEAVNARTDAEKAAAVVKREILKLQLEGVTITPQLVAALQEQAAAQVEGAERLKTAQETAKFSAESYWDSVRDGAFDALQDVRNLEDGLKALAGQLLKMAAQDLWKFGFGEQTGGLGGLLFGSGGISFGGGKAAAKGGGGFLGTALNILGSLFETGGYTGPGGRKEPAGVVHKGEVVWSQDDVARWGGPAAVDSMRRGIPGYSSGGVVGLAPRAVPTAAPRSARGSSSNVTLHSRSEFHFSGGAPQEQTEAFRRMLDERDAKLKRETMAAMVRANRNDPSLFE